jgi:hypothetical protein
VIAASEVEITSEQPKGEGYGTWNSLMDAGHTAADYHSTGNIQPVSGGCGDYSNVGRRLRRPSSCRKLWIMKKALQRSTKID